MAQHMAQQNAEGSRDLSTLVDASAELQHLVQTIWRLRQPDGCPWDREQTHQSIGKNMIEEAYEALDCIEADDAAHLREELGDVLMQVVLHAQIAADAGEFTLADVARDIDAKLIRRHPHVFGDADADNSDEVLKIWDEVKLAEKAAKDKADELLQQGCQWAVNLDGGGSTTLSVLLPGSSAPAVDNSPSGGSLRACATFILLVTDAPTDREPERLALQQDGLTVLTGSSLTLGDVAAVDGGAATVSSRVSDAEFSSKNELGSFNGSIYTAGDRAGTDEIAIRSRDLDLTGSAQIHVVDTLTSLTVSRAGSTSPLTALTLEAGESVQLTASGSYWSREALRPGSGGVTWSVEGDVGSITPDGVFTSGGTGSSGTITATAGGLTSKVTVGLENVHNDVTPEHWSYPAVEYCYEHGIVSGVSSTEFGRDHSIRRGDFVLMLYNALGKPAVTGSSGFSDVSPSDYYAQAITWASANHLVSGVAEGLFGPTDLVTREQAFTILHQAMPLLGLSSPEPDLTVLDRFADRDQIAEYARPHAAALVSQGLASGAGGVLNPKGQLTRAEMAALLYQLIFNDVPAGQLGHVIELAVHGGLDQNIAVLGGIEPDHDAEGLDHAGTEAHEGRVGVPAVAALLPVLHGLEIAGGPGGVAPDALLGPGLQRVNDGLGGPEVHIRDPQGDHIVGAELLDPFVILGGEVFGAVYHLVEIILHDSHILSLRVQWHVCML